MPPVLFGGRITGDTGQAEKTRCGRLPTGLSQLKESIALKCEISKPYLLDLHSGPKKPGGYSSSGRR